MSPSPCNTWLKGVAPLALPEPPLASPCSAAAAMPETLFMRSPAGSLRDMFTKKALETELRHHGGHVEVWLPWKRDDQRGFGFATFQDAAKAEELIEHSTATYCYFYGYDYYELHRRCAPVELHRRTALLLRAPQAHSTATYCYYYGYDYYDYYYDYYGLYGWPLHGAGDDGGGGFMVLVLRVPALEAGAAVHRQRHGRRGGAENSRGADGVARDVQGTEWPGRGTLLWAARRRENAH